MDKARIKALIKKLAQLDYQGMYMDDFLLTWEKSDQEVMATFLVAEILRGLPSPKCSVSRVDISYEFSGRPDTDNI